MIVLLGWLSSVFIIASLIQQWPIPFSLLNLSSAIVLLAFNLLIRLWPVVVLNITILFVNAYQLPRQTARIRQRGAVDA